MQINKKQEEKKFKKKPLSSKKIVIAAQYFKEPSVLIQEQENFLKVSKDFFSRKSVPQNDLNVQTRKKIQKP